MWEQSGRASSWRDSGTNWYGGKGFVPPPWTLRHTAGKNDGQLHLPENPILLFRLHFQVPSQGLCTVLSPFPKSLNYRFSDGTWGVGGLRKNNSRMLKRQSDGGERSYAGGEVATTRASCSPAMAGELRNTKSACSSLRKTNDECNPRATPGQHPVTKLFPTSPSGVRVLRLLRVKHLLRPLNRAKVGYLLQLARLPCGLISFSGFIPFTDFVSSQTSPLVLGPRFPSVRLLQSSIWKKALLSKLTILT